MEIDWIEPGVLAASHTPYDLDDLYALHAQGIRAIVSLTEDSLPHVTDIPVGMFDQLDMTYYHVPIPDGFPPDIAEADQIIAFIDQMAAQHRPTLIHCHAGMGRTGTLLHAYYLARGMALEDVKDRVEQRRSVCTFRLLTEYQQTFLYEYAEAKRRDD